MLIAQLEPPHATRGGDWFYRTDAPGRAMAGHDGVFVLDATNLHRCREALFRDADVLVINMVCDPDLLPVIAARRRRGQVTVYEVNDDVAWMQPWNPAAAFYADPDHQALFRCLVRSCDAAQFSTAELERVYGRLSAKTAIFPNQISRTVAPPRARAPARPVVVGWGGSAGHLDDVANVAPALIAWLDRRDDAVLHLMGSDRIWELFRRLPDAKKRRYPPGDMDAYYAFLAGLDIGVAPLEDTGFNRCRSDVKFLEYALSSVTPVMKHLAPYQSSVEHGVTGFLYRDNDELVATLDDLVAKSDLGRAVAERARAYVEGHRTESRHSGRRLDLYRCLLGRAPGDGAARFERLCSSSGIAREGRHATLEHGAYESLVLQALARGQLEGQSAEALSWLERAAALEPSAYQPHLFGANWSPDPIASLSASLRKNPESVGAQTLLAEHLARSGKLASAVEMLLRATEICPSYDVPYLAAARILRDAGHEQEAKEFAQLALSLRRPLIELYAG
jgi:glycosyltransferase involved in cell wall biosynthesis